jgi:hypothetical protein
MFEVSNPDSDNGGTDPRDREKNRNCKPGTANYFMKRIDNG